VHFLDEIADIADTGVTAAERLLEAYHGRWHGSVNPAFEELSY
jgi:glutamate--cysteine ligase